MLNKILLLICSVAMATTSFAQKKFSKESFELIQLNDNGNTIKVPAQRTEIRFDYKGKAINGNVGCNNFFGKLTMPKHHNKKGNIQIEAIGSTKMYCDNMQIEDATFKLLKQADNFKRKGNKLLLRKGRKVLMELRRKG